MFESFNVDNLENSKEVLTNKVQESKEEIQKLLEIENKTYENFVMPYMEIGERLNEFITPVFSY